jgi:hypothetical protein
MVKKFVSSFDLDLLERFRTHDFMLDEGPESLLCGFGFFHVLLGDTAFGCGSKAKASFTLNESANFDTAFLWKFICVRRYLTVHFM